MKFTFSTWLIWAVVLLIQNFAFTFVSRARSSGSLKRHLVASIGSNGVWFLSQTIIFSQMFKIMKGDYGLKTAIFVGVYYTAFTVTGSILAHYWALKTEKGKSRVGAFKDEAKFTLKEGELIRSVMRYVVPASAMSNGPNPISDQLQTSSVPSQGGRF